MKALLVVIATCGLLGSPVKSLAQTTAPVTPTTYEFMTVLEAESPANVNARVVFAPAFQGKSEIQLEAVPVVASNKYLSAKQKNTQLINQQLSEVTAAGWELVHVSGGDYVTRYLFRKPKR